jgi:predicted nucleotidyltransferase
VNADGKSDLVTSTQTKIAVLAGNGDGTFQKTVHYPSGRGQVSPAVKAGDFNSDGDLDLAVADSVSSGVNSTLTLFPGSGDGVFVSHLNFLASKGPGPSSVATGDFNGDGKLDVALANLTNNRISVFLQTQ